MSLKSTGLRLSPHPPGENELNPKLSIIICFQLNSKFQNEESPSAIYAISMAWFKEWENFVKARLDGEYL